MSFFLTTPAKKPRTECGCQSVAFMIAAIVVPFGCRSIPNTVSCLDEALVDFTVACLGVADVIFDSLERCFFAGERRCDCFAMLFAGFDFGLLVAISLSCLNDSITCCH